MWPSANVIRARAFLPDVAKSCRPASFFPTGAGLCSNNSARDPLTGESPPSRFCPPSVSPSCCEVAGPGLVLCPICRRDLPIANTFPRSLRPTSSLADFDVFAQPQLTSGRERQHTYGGAVEKRKAKPRGGGARSHRAGTNAGRKEGGARSSQARRSDGPRAPLGGTSRAARATRQGTGRMATVAKAGAPLLALEVPSAEAAKPTQEILASSRGMGSNWQVERHFCELWVSPGG